MTDRLDRIRKIAKEIDKLSRELQDLLNFDLTIPHSELPSQIDLSAITEQVSSTVRTDSQIKVGSRVKITNNHRNMSGLLGTVRKVNALFLSIRLDNGETVRKAKYNVELLIG